MKRELLLTWILAATLCVPVTMQGQRHRHHPTTSTPQAASVADTIASSPVNQNADTAAVEAFSDTTSTAPVSADTSKVVTNGVTNDWDEEWEGDFDDFSVSDWHDLINSFNLGVGGVIFAVLVVILVILLLLSPFLLLGFIAWLIVRNRNRRYKIAEKAVEQGNEIPEPLLKEEKVPDEDLWRSGIRNIFLGFGIAIAFSIWHSSTISAIGWVLAFYGIGQVVIAKTSKKKENESSDDLEKRM